MKKILFIFILLIFVIPAYAKENEKLDVKSQSFMDLGRYVETLEINENTNDDSSEKIIQDDNFEEEAIIDVAKRYEENSVELNLNDVDDTALEEVNSDRVFKLKVNETQYRIEQEIKAENMIWDSSKSFSQAFLNDTRHMAPIPGVVNSSKITANLGSSISAQLGQTFLYDANGPSVLFVRANEST